jgi:hypothetical protein
MRGEYGGRGTTTDKATWFAEREELPMTYWLSLRKEELMKRLRLLLALVVVVTMIMIVSAMPAMAKGKPSDSGGGGKGKGGGYGVVVHQDKGGDDVYNKKGMVCNSCNND